MRDKTKMSLHDGIGWAWQSDLPSFNIITNMPLFKPMTACKSNTVTVPICLTSLLNFNLILFISNWWCERIFYYTTEDENTKYSLLKFSERHKGTLKNWYSKYNIYTIFVYICKNNNNKIDLYNIQIVLKTKNVCRVKDNQLISILPQFLSVYI